MKRIGISLLTIIILLALPAQVSADVAPPYNPPGVNPGPGSESTQVRMLAETVVIEVRDDGGLGRARVTADFSMRNLGGASESLAVRFPISADNGRGDFPEITSLSIQVDGGQTPYRRVDYLDLDHFQEQVPWAEFDVEFPPGQDVTLQVAYDLEGSGYFPYTAFFYVLHTGAGWKGTIGSADIILRLPYEASPQNVVLDLQIGWAQTTRGGTFRGNEVRWHFEDFEPDPDGPVRDMEFALVSPSSWSAVMKEQAGAAENPNDGEAWGRLGKSYKEVFFMSKAYRSDAGGELLYDASVEAYEKCLSIKPQDAQWHAGFADLLASRAYWDAWNGFSGSDPQRALSEIHTALELSPNDPLVRQIAQDISSMLPEGMIESGSGFDFPWLTSTPTAVPPTATIVPAFEVPSLRGTYLSNEIHLLDGPAQLRLVLNSDHSAELTVAGGQAGAQAGSWQDMGDGMLKVVVSDEYGEPSEFLFAVEGRNLQAHQYPGSYGEGLLEMKKIDPLPPPATGTPSPPTGSPSPLCGSAALAPLALILWMKRKRGPGGLQS